MTPRRGPGSSRFAQKRTSVTKKWRDSHSNGLLKHVMENRNFKRSGAWKRRWLFAVTCVVAASAISACRSVRGDEALVLIDVAAAPDVPPFGMLRFSVTGRPEIAPAEAAFPA